MPAATELFHRQHRATSYRDALEHHHSSATVKPAPGLRSGLVALSLLVGDTILWSGLFAGCFWLLQAFASGSNLPNPSVILIPLGVSLVSSWLVGAYDRDTDFRSLRFASEFLIAGAFATVFGAGLTALVGSYGSAQLTSRFLLLATPFAFTILSLILRRQLAGCAGWDQNGVRRVLLLGNPEEAASLQRALQLAGRPAMVERLDPSLATPEVVADYLRRRALQLTPDDTSETELTLRNSAHQNSESPASEVDSGVHHASGPAASAHRLTSNPSPPTGFVRNPVPPTSSPVPLGAIVLGPSADPLMAGLSPFLVSLHTSRLPVYTWPAFWRQRVRMHDVHDSSTAWLFDRDFRLNTTTVYWHLKRLFDIVHSAAALLLASPILVIAWIAIRLDSPGPALFRQQRIGFRGEPFTIYKFRSMKLNSEAAGTTTVPGDSRITRLGHFLRRSRIDEIPQLFNVLKGDMSFVGPRPEWTVCVDLYEQQLPYYHLRHLVKPGLTGWAQVNYPYGQDVYDARNKLSFDLYYVTHASLVLDSTIILKTLYVVLGRIGGR